MKPSAVTPGRMVPASWSAASRAQIASTTGAYPGCAGPSAVPTI